MTLMRAGAASASAAGIGESTALVTLGECPTDGTLEVGDLARFLDLAAELYEGSESPGWRQSVADG